VTGSDLDPRQGAAARLWAAHQHPYLATAIFATSLVSRPGSEAVAVDEGWRVYVDPDLVAGWPAERLGAELVHHAGHLLRDHASRARALGLADDEIGHWVDAADAEIADDLPPAVQQILDAATPEDLDAADGLFAEEYFHQGMPRAHGHRDCGSGAHGRERPWDEQSPGDDGGRGGVGAEEAEMIRRKVASDVMEHQRREGATPAGLVRWAEAVLAPTVDWRRLLGSELRRGVTVVAGSVDYTYARPSRRASSSPGVVLPSMRARSPEIAVVCDTSASMSGELLDLALTEIDGLLSSVGVRPDSVRVLTCDADPTPAQRVRTSRQIELVGGGGTDMTAGISRASELRPRPDLVVVVTDGFTPWPDGPPEGSRVVVVLLGDDAPSAPSWAREVRVA
jgi:predicted metal-dependent peptidase